MLIFCGLLALMLLYMVGYAKTGQLWSRLCSFFYVSVCLPFILYAFSFVYGSGSAPYSVFRSLASNIGVPTFPFCLHCIILQRCPTPQTITWKPSRRRMFFAPCTPQAYGLRLVWKRHIKAKVSVDDVLTPWQTVILRSPWQTALTVKNRGHVTESTLHAEKLWAVLILSYL